LPTPAPCTVRAIADDRARLWRYARDHGFANEIKRLHSRFFLRLAAAAASDWLSVIVSVGAVVAWGLAWAPVAILVIGSRQRALGNLLHDAAHAGYGRRDADSIARWLLCRPMWTNLDLYRREHFAHHRSLGAAGCDGDLIHCEADMRLAWLPLLWRHVADRRTWLGSALGQLHRVGRGELALMLGWWAALIATVTLGFGPRAALTFAALWLISRATTFHLITTFREISDHVGLQPGTLIGFCRNQTKGGVLGALIHPHNNGYHLVHHLDPLVPFHALPRAHALLMAWPEYAAACHCRTYFAGDAALVRSWVRQAPASSRAIKARRSTLP